MDILSFFALNKDLELRLRLTSDSRFCFRESTILGFHANAKLLDFAEKLKTASDKYRINIVTWSFVPFVIK